MNDDTYPKVASQSTRDLGSAIHNFLLSRAEMAETDASSLRSRLRTVRERINELCIDDAQLEDALTAPSDHSMWSAEQRVVRLKMLEDSRDLLDRISAFYDRRIASERDGAGFAPGDLPVGEAGIALLALARDLIPELAHP